MTISYFFVKIIIIKTHPVKFIRLLTLYLVLATTNSYMQSAGLTETRSHPPIQNSAKASKLRYQEEHPHFVYSLLGAVYYSNFLSVNLLFNSLVVSKSYNSIKSASLQKLSKRKSYKVINSLDFILIFEP